MTPHRIFLVQLLVVFQVSAYEFIKQFFPLGAAPVQWRIDGRADTRADPGTQWLLQFSIALPALFTLGSMFFHVLSWHRLSSTRKLDSSGR